MNRDWQLPDHLAEFARTGGDDLIDDHLGVFLDDTPSSISRLADAARRGDRVAVFHEAHSLRGSALQVGADALAGVAGTLENGVSADRWPELLDEVAHEFDLVSAQIRSHISRP